MFLTFTQEKTMRRNILKKMVVYAVSCALLVPMAVFGAEINKHTFKFAYMNTAVLLGE